MRDANTESRTIRARLLRLARFLPKRMLWLVVLAGAFGEWTTNRVSFAVLRMPRFDTDVLAVVVGITIAVLAEQAGPALWWILDREASRPLKRRATFIASSGLMRAARRGGDRLVAELVPQPQRRRRADRALVHSPVRDRGDDHVGLGGRAQPVPRRARRDRGASPRATEADVEVARSNKNAADEALNDAERLFATEAGHVVQYWEIFDAYRRQCDARAGVEPQRQGSSRRGYWSSNHGSTSSGR